VKKIYLIFVFVWVSLFIHIHAQTPITYKDVAPIFYSKCTVCHNPLSIGTTAPLMNYTETHAYKNFIYTYVSQGLMPPWPPDTAYHTFFGQRVLTAYEKNEILTWIDSGAVAGDTTLAPLQPVYTTNYQLHGTPDLVVKIPPFVSNATSADAYNCFVIPTGLTQDRIVRAFEIVPGNAAIVHHALISMDTSATPPASDLSGNCFTMPGSAVNIGGYAPGSQAVLYPGKPELTIGFRLKANCNIVFQIHYPAGTAGQTDSTFVRFFFYPVGTTGIREIKFSELLQNWTMNIAPNTVQTYTASYPNSGGVPSPLSIYATFPHQHKVGVSITNYAYSGVDTIPLIRINNWDFRWQGYYIYPMLVKIPTGYTVEAAHTYDNTSNNPNNPFSPPQRIYAGLYTTNEMLFDAYQYLPYQPGDDTINISNLLQGDTLLSVNNRPPALNITAKAFPNPFSAEVHIGYNINTQATVTINVYSIYGTKVRTLVNHQKTMGAGYYESIWDGKNDSGSPLTSGVYIYTIVADKATASGKFVLMK